MTSPDRRKILLALDISPRSRSALAIAAGLAAEIDAELAGVFVEDVNVIRLSGLPFSRAVGTISSRSRALAVAEVEAALRREAEAVQRQLAETAGRHRLRWSFQVARGHISSELFARVSALDLVVIGKRPCAGVRSLADTLGVRPAPSKTAAPVMLLYDGSGDALRALQLAAQMARATSAELHVLVTAASDAGLAQALEQARPKVEQAAAKQPCSLRPFSGGGAELAAAVRRARAAALVVLDEPGLRAGAGFAALLNEVDCPVILVE